MERRNWKEGNVKLEEVKEELEIRGCRNWKEGFRRIREK
jgi:hypothetical protein